MQEQLNGVDTIYSTGSALAAKLLDGDLVPWRHGDRGADIRPVQEHIMLRDFRRMHSSEKLTIEIKMSPNDQSTEGSTSNVKPKTSHSSSSSSSCSSSGDDDDDDDDDDHDDVEG